MRRSIKVYVTEIVIGDVLEGDGSTVTKVERKKDDQAQVILHCHDTYGSDYTCQYGEDDTEYVYPPVVIQV